GDGQRTAVSGMGQPQQAPQAVLLLGRDLHTSLSPHRAISLFHSSESILYCQVFPLRPGKEHVAINPVHAIICNVIQQGHPGVPCAWRLPGILGKPYFSIKIRWPKKGTPIAAGPTDLARLAAPSMIAYPGKDSSVPRGLLPCAGSAP